MHTSALAFESATLASVLSLAFAMIALYAYWLGLRLRWLLFGAGGWAVLAIYFGLLAISAGPAPALPRSEMALGLRLSLILAYALFGVFFVYVACFLLKAGVLWFGWTER